MTPRHIAVYVCCAALSTSVARAQPSRPPLAAPPVVAAAGTARAIDLARTWFPQTQGWFRIVAGGRFDVSTDGRLTPDFASLTHPRVRRADNAGYTLAPRFPLRYDGWLRVASGQHPDAWVELAPVDARLSSAAQQDGVIVYPDAYADTDVFYKSTPTHVDEYLLVRSHAAPSEWVFRLRRGRRIASVRQTGNAVEAVDAQGRAWLRASRPVAVDRSGHRATGEVIVRGDELVVRIDLSALEMPALVDPDWTSTADMSFGRFYAAANVLPSGRVLATGGCSASVCSGDLTLPACRTVLREAETLDLSTRTWSRAGDDLAARFFHSAESLDSGAVLLAGGCVDPTCAAASDAVTLYAPESATFGAVATLSEARAGIASVRLRDGRVLLAGGCTATGASSRVELYDPRARVLTRASPMPTARGRAELVTLRDGRVLVTGGCTTIACAGVSAAAEIYDPVADRWTAASPMSTPRGGHFAVLLDDGRALIGGGCPDGACSSYLRSTEFFDPAGMRFVPGPAMAQMRLGARAVRVADGRVMVNQGCSGRAECDLSNELFDPRASTFSRIEDAVTMRAFHALVLHDRAHLAIAIGGCQPRTCSWWNETYDVSNFRPPADAGVDGGADAGVDATAADVSAPDVMTADASRADVHGADAPQDAAPPSRERPGACACATTLGGGGSARVPVGLALLALLSVSRRSRRGRR